MFTKIQKYKTYKNNDNVNDNVNVNIVRLVPRAPSHFAASPINR